MSTSRRAGRDLGPRWLWALFGAVSVVIVAAAAGFPGSVWPPVSTPPSASCPGRPDPAPAAAGIHGELYRSLREMARKADAIVVGRIVGVRPGRVVDEPGADDTFFSIATVEVERCVSGPLGPGDRVSVEYLVSRLGEDPGAENGAPRGTSVFLLRDVAAWNAQRGDAQAAREMAGIHWLVTLDAVFTDRSGVVAVQRSGEEYIQALDGSSFAALVATLDQYVSE